MIIILVVVRDLQPLANYCREIYVWHTRTETPKLDAETKLRKEGQKSNDGMEVWIFYEQLFLRVIPFQAIFFLNLLLI